MSINNIIQLTYYNENVYEHDISLQRENSKNNARIKENNNKIVEFIIPTKETFLVTTNYNVIQLKEICKHYKLKVSGVKKELIERITVYFKQNDSIKIIQRACRNYIYRKYVKLRGPARLTRSLCVNDNDFYTIESIKDIPFSQFFSYKDSDGKIYGFNIISLYSILFTHKDDVSCSNPYNRNTFPKYVYKKIKKILKLSKVVNEVIHTSVSEDDDDIDDEVPLSAFASASASALVGNIITPELEVEYLCNSLFQYIDRLGNYTDPNWLLSLNAVQLSKFIHELNDIWFYRSQLSHQTRVQICPPLGNPFINAPINLFNVNRSVLEWKRISLNIIENMIKKAVASADRSLGANYVLCALTLVSEHAAHAIPWLYHSVSY